MAKHLLDIITFLGTIYLLYIELTFMYYKFKHDSRFEGIGFLKYAQEPIKTLKGRK